MNIVELAKLAKKRKISAAEIQKYQKKLREAERQFSLKSSERAPDREFLLRTYSL